MSTLTFASTLGGSVNLIGPNISAITNFTLPSADGTANQVLITNGSGALTFSNIPLATSVSGLLPIANGGTNSSATATAGGIGYGTGTAHAYSSAGTSGYLLQSNGSSAPSWVVPPGGFSNIAVFTSSGTWSVPAGVTKCKVTVTGGGAGSTGFGGNAGATAIKILTLSGSSATITVGAGGAVGNDGGNSTFVYGATTITGGKGFNGPNSPSTATNGDINIPGGLGSNTTAPSNYAGGIGGASYWGGGGSNQLSQGAGIAGQAYGSGGGGGGYNDTTNAAGKQGIVVIEY